MTAVLLKLPCGHRVDLAGHGAAPDMTSPLFQLADVTLFEEDIDELHRSLARWTVHLGRAVAEGVEFFHCGTGAEPLMQSVGRYRGRPQGREWYMFLEPAGGDVMDAWWTVKRGTER